MSARWSSRHIHNAASRLALTCGVVAVVCVRPVSAQQSIGEILSFLVTNRSIPTDDFVGDAQAAAATRDTISDFLMIELATLPISSPAGGFIYRLNPSLGTVARLSESFGPFFAERTLSVGRKRSSLGLSYQSASFDNIDGRNLRDGTLVSTASTFGGEAQPFDVETVALRLHTDTMTLSGNFGVTDRLDIGAAVPFVRLTLKGERVDTYRGRALIQAAGSASASGVGDVVLRVKYNVLRRGRSGLAVGGESRLPTGDTDNLLGAGQVAFQPRVMGSFEGDRVAVHGNIGRSFRDRFNELNYGGAVTVVAAERLTLVAELVGRRLQSFGRLVQTTELHPSLARVETIRLTGIEQATDRLVAVAGFKWNVAGAWLVSAHVLRPMTTAGLNARWVPTVTFDYSFGR